MKTSYDVLIIGGGIVGLSLALSLAERGLSLALIDQGSLAHAERADSRALAINQASKALFTALKVWPLIEESSPYQRMEVWDEGSKAEIDFDSRLLALSELGLIIEQGVILKALLQRLKEFSNLDVFPQVKLSSIVEEEKEIVITSDSQQWQGRLLCICDGALSTARSLLKIPMISWPYHQKALVAKVKTQYPHRRTAYQVFKSSGPLAFLPLKDENYSSIVWSNDSQKADWLLSLDESSFNAALTQAFGKKLGEVSLMTKPQAFPLVMRHVSRYVGKRWLLLGDAAHTIHPLAGLGLNVGLADLSSFLIKLDFSQEEFFSSRSLSAYQRERKAELWKIITLMSGLKTLFSNPLPIVSGLRGLGLNFCNRFTPLKRFLIEEASGLRI